MFTGTVRLYRGAAQLTHPDYQLVGTDVDDEAAALVEASRPIPVYPASAALPTWRIQRAVRTVLDPLTAADVPDPLPQEVRDLTGLPTLLEALRLVHEPFADDDWHRGRRRLRHEEAFVLQAALARRRIEAAARPGVARPGATGGAARRVRRPAAVHAHRRPARGRRGDRRRISRPPTPCSACSRGRSDRARRWSRCERCSRWSTPAVRRRCSRRPRCSPPSTCARCATCSGRWRRRACSARPSAPPGSCCSPGRSPRRSGAMRCSTPPRARRGSWSAPTRCSASGSSSPTSAWSWSTSSTASASSSATRCAHAAGRTTPSRTCSS